MFRGWFGSVSSPVGTQRSFLLLNYPLSQFSVKQNKKKNLKKLRVQLFLILLSRVPLFQSVQDCPAEMFLSARSGIGLGRV